MAGQFVGHLTVLEVEFSEILEEYADKLLEKQVGLTKRYYNVKSTPASIKVNALTAAEYFNGECVKITSLNDKSIAKATLVDLPFYYLIKLLMITWMH